MAQFQKGNSGNPSGKPKGAKDKRTALRSLLETHRDSLVKAVVDKALAGDTTALRICLDRLIAPVRGNPLTIGKLSGTLSDRGEQVMDAISRGDISTEEATSLMSVIQSQAKIIEATELEERIATLETLIKNGEKYGNN